MSGTARFVFACAIFACISASDSYALDSVDAFIAEADSLSLVSDDASFTEIVSQNTVLIGAAVARLVDAAITAGDGGDAEGETHAFDLAARLASLYSETTGSSTLVELVSTSRNWQPDQRQLRRDARSLEAKAATLRDHAYQTGQNSEFAQAAELLREAIQKYTEINDQCSWAVTWGSLGIVYFYAGDLAAVETSYDRALEARRAVENRILEGRTLNGLGTLNFQRGAYVAAVGYYEQAIALRRQTADRVGLGTSLTYLGNSYYRMNRWIDARDAYESAFAILETAGEPRQLAENLISVAGLYFDMGRTGASTDAYLRALDYAQRSGDVQTEIKCRNNLALNYRAQFRYSEALEHLNAVESLLAQNLDPLERITFYQNRGLVYLNIGDTDRARDDLLAFLKAAEAQGSAMYRIEALKTLGFLLIELGDYERASKYAAQALVIANELNDARMIRSARMVAAQIERLQGSYDDALAQWEAAFVADQRLSASNWMLQDQLGIANIYNLAGSPDRAREIYLSVRPAVEESGVGDLIVVLRLGLAHSYEKADADSAAFYYESALSFLESTRETLHGDDVRRDYLSGSRRYYYEEVARYYASLAEDDPDGAWASRSFQTIERAKARGLFDLLQMSVMSNESAEESELLDALYRLDSASQDYDAQRQSLTRRYQSARDARIESSLAGLSGARVATIDEVRKTLPKRTVVLAYALGDSASLLWAIDRDGGSLMPLPSRKALQADVVRLRDALTTPGAGDAALKSSARSLYQALVQPAGERLARARRLIIVPDGFLFEIPFEVLLTEDVTDDMAWGELPFLARSFAPVYAPSVSIYLNLEKARESHHNLDLLAVGDPDFTTLARAPGNRAALAQLPYTRTEVMNISAHLDDDRKDVLLGEDANEARFKRELRENSPRMIHLATHGLVDPVDPAASSIALGVDEESGDDGYLDTMEILSLPLDSDLVVLSACESGRGRLSRSEGVVGLSRAFMASGARSIVASLWAVSDQSTSVFMEMFYDKMLDDKEPAGEALNEARFALMNDPAYAHPFYWSPFILIGSERSPW